MGQMQLRHRTNTIAERTRELHWVRPEKSRFEAFMRFPLLAGIPTPSYFPPHRIELLHHCNALEWLIPSDCFPLSFISTIDNDPASPTLTSIQCFRTFQLVYPFLFLLRNIENYTW